MTKISDFKDVHRGKRLFILASGPSLAELDLTPLRRRIVMGLNRSLLAYPDAHYHCVMDERLFVEYEDLLRRTRCLFTLEGRPFGEGGAYEKLAGTIHFAFDPDNPYNARIVDLKLAPRNEAGLVEAHANFMVLKPKDPNKSNGVAYVEVSNRGGKATLTVVTRPAGS